MPILSHIEPVLFRSNYEQNLFHFHLIQGTFLSMSEFQSIFFYRDVRDIKKVGKSHSFLFHSACIWGMEMYPMLNDGQKPVLPPGSFVTCSSDDTIRIWNISSHMANNTIYKRNIYSDDLLKTLYIDNQLTHIKETDTSQVNF